MISEASYDVPAGANVVTHIPADREVRKVAVDGMRARVILRAVTYATFKHFTPDLRGFPVYWARVEDELVNNGSVVIWPAPQQNIGIIVATEAR